MTQNSYTPVPDGKPGIWATLQRMAELIRSHAPSVTVYAQALQQEILDLAASQHRTLSHAEIAAILFDWVRLHMFYVDDETSDPINAPGVDILDKIQHPDVMLDEIDRLGQGMGDCDDYIILLGSLYHDLDYGVTLVNVVQASTEQEHVYLRVTTPEGVFAADPIIEEPFGWEIPRDEITEESVVPV